MIINMQTLISDNRGFYNIWEKTKSDILKSRYYTRNY